MSRPTFAFVAWVILVALATSGTGAVAQETATPAAAETAPTAPLGELLVRTTLEGLPEPPTIVRLLRLSLPPGASVPLHTLTGPEFAYVESGAVTVLVEGEAVVAPAGDPAVRVPAAVAPVGEAFALLPGDQLALPAGVPVTFGNEGQEPATLLTLLFVPADDEAPELTWVDGTPAPEALVGTSSRLLAEATATEWPAGPLQVVVDRLALAPGESIPGAAGPVLLAVESGRFSFALLEGEFQISRAGGGSEPVATPGVAYALGPGDSVFFPTSLSDVPRPDDLGLLVLLRLSVLPVADAPAEDAAAAPSAGAETETAGDIAEGAAVLVSETGVRLREAPTADAEVVTELSAGTELVVSGPPREEDGIVWYPVAGVDDPSVDGFIAEKFLLPEEE